MPESSCFEAARQSGLHDAAVVRSKRVDATRKAARSGPVERGAARPIVSNEPPSRGSIDNDGEVAEERVPVRRALQSMLIRVQQVNGRWFVVAAAPACDAVRTSERRRTFNGVKRRRHGERGGF